MNDLKIRHRICVLFTMGIAILFSGCMHETEMPGPGIDNEEVMRVVLDFANDLKHDRHLRLEDSTVYYGNYGNYIEKVRLKFITQNILELCEARELLVDVGEGFLDRLNEDPCVGPLIAGYPVGPENLEIFICFESYFLRYVDKRYIAWAVLQDGLSFFYAGTITNEFEIWDRDSENWHQRVEPYSKSVQMVGINREAERMYQERHPKPSSLFAGDRILDDQRSKGKQIVQTAL